MARKHHTSMKINDGHFLNRWGFFSDWFTQFDMFSSPITLTYKGKSTFRTTWGACVSIITSLVLIWIVVGLGFQTYFQTVKKYTVYRDLVNPSLSDPDLSSPSFSFGNLSLDKTDLQSMTLTDAANLFRIVNLNSLTAELGKVEMYRTSQDETVSVGIL